MSDSLARALAAPAPAAQPMGNQDMLARILMGNPDPGLPQYPVMEQAAPLAPTMRTGLNNDMWRSAKIAEALRNDVNELFAARDPSRNYGTILPISSDPNTEGSTRFDLKGGLTGDLLAMLGAGGRAMRGEEYNPMDISMGMMTAAAPSLASRSSGVLHSAGGSARDGIRAYHGSPHQFDRFDMSRIGTGEGAQAYGHGLYFAGNEGVARSYRDQLSSEVYRTPKGDIWSPDNLQHLNVRNQARQNPFELGFAISRAEDLLKTAPSATRPMLEADLATLRALQDAGGLKPTAGSMYEVRLNTTPDRLLDWDAPLSGRNPIRDMIGDLGQQYLNTGSAEARNVARDALMAAKNENLSGAGVYNQLTRLANIGGAIGEHLGPLSPPIMSGPSVASQTLREAGIPGIQYLDAGSRAAGDGTRNYVMFDDSLIDILRRYGLAGMLAGGAASQAQAGEPSP